MLDRVGGLLLLPNTELATTKQVAEFYGVSPDYIRVLFNRNKAELENQGAKSMSYQEIQGEIFNRNKTIRLEPNLKELGISPRGSISFTRRAILIVGCMLEKSKVAQEVRNQLVNIAENSSDEVKSMEITKEKQLLMAIMFAENEVERATAINTHLE